MTQDQIIAALRNALSFFGGVAVSKGWVDSNTLLQAGGLIAPVVGMYFAWRASSAKAQVEKVAAMPGTTVVTTPEVAQASPSDNVKSNATTDVVAK